VVKINLSLMFDPATVAFIGPREGALFLGRMFRNAG